MAAIAVAVCTLSSKGQPAPPATTAPAGDPTVEYEVLQNVRNQKIGGVTLDALRIPESFLIRVADRVIRSSYEERYRIVVPDSPPATAPASPPPTSAPASRPANNGASPADRITVLSREIPDAVRRYRRSLPEGRPPIRGFRPAFTDDDATAWPFDIPGPNAPENLRRAATIVAEYLAADGLLATTARAIDALGPALFIDDPPTALKLLRAAGIPVDLLACFGPPAPAPADVPPIVTRIAQQLHAANPLSAVEQSLRETPFFFRPSHPEFRVATESGEHDIDALRLQLTGGDYWSGPGDGGCLDLARQLVEQLPDARFIASIERRHLDAFLERAADWPLRDARRLTLLPEDLPVAQWAQDNARVGFIGPAEGGFRRVAMLIPRYASRGEEAATFVPGETFLLEGLAAAGHTLIHSPLLFQGGNLLPVLDPATGRRILLVGEAEIYRNIALGLSWAQVLDAFRVEFAVDDCVVLPAASFHIDYEVTVRAHNGRLVAFVGDVPSAVLGMLACGFVALEKAGRLDAATAARARALLARQNAPEVLSIVSSVIFDPDHFAGHLTESLARPFSVGPADSHVGNFQRFLLSADILAALSLRSGQLPPDRHAAAYLRSFLRRADDLARLHQRLANLGWRLVAVPGISDGNRSLCYVNGIQTPSAYFMPVYGGLFEPIDRQAETAFHRILGPGVRIVPIRCSETLRRNGALHCSVSVLPRP